MVKSGTYVMNARVKHGGYQMITFFILNTSKNAWNIMLKKEETVLSRKYI